MTNRLFPTAGNVANLSHEIRKVIDSAADCKETFYGPLSHGLKNRALTVHVVIVKQYSLDGYCKSTVQDKLTSLHADFESDPY